MNTPNRPAKFDYGLLLMAVINWCMVLVARQYGNWGLAWYTAIQPLYTVILCAVLVLLMRRPVQRAAGDRMVVLWLAAGIAGPLGLAMFGRANGLGDSWEVLTLLVLANWGLILALLARRGRLGRMSAVVSCSCCFLVVSIFAKWPIALLAAVFGCVLLWRLTTEYWLKLEQKLAAEQQREWSVQVFVLAGSILLIAALGSLGMFLPAARSLNLPGLSWFSGGNRWSDEYAREGTGDGNQVRAATDTASSFGPVDSDIFMESKKESLFDVASDMYGKPRKPNRNRSVALEADFLRHNHSRIARSQKVSAEFSTRRQAKSAAPPRPPEDQLSDVLFFFKGRLPMRLALETYSTLEDGVWKQFQPVEAGPPPQVAEGANPDGDRPRRARGGRDVSRLAPRPQSGPRLQPVDMRPALGTPWMWLRNHPGTIYESEEYSAVKITNLDSVRIPSTPCLERFAIDRVDRPDFFGVGPDGIPQMTSGAAQIPEMTVVHLRSSGINLFAAKSRPERFRHRLEHHADAMQDYRDRTGICEEVQRLAREWTRGVEGDWDRVEAITSRLRFGFRHDPDGVLPDDQPDAAEHLLQTGAGTDYMFATTAALMLRSLDIPSRVVSGFLASEANHDRKTGHTAVRPADIHVWVEVSLDGEHWIPVEPTPGFPLPRYRLTWSQRAWLGVIAIRNWLIARYVLVLIGLAGAGLLWRFRRRIASIWVTIRWQLTSQLVPGRLVPETARLIEKRAMLAGVPRPASVSPPHFSRWLGGWLEVPEQELSAIHRFSGALDRFLYRPHPGPAEDAAGARQANRDCAIAVRNLPFKQIRKKQKLNQGES